MDDEKIIGLYFDRDEEAIRQTAAVYGRRLFGLSQGIVRSKPDAEECVSDTYYRTWNSIPPRRPEHFFGYLAKICRNLSLNRLERAKAAKRKAEVVCLTQEMEQCIPDVHREKEVEARELGRLLNGFLGTLSQENRMIFVRRYWYVESAAEIAQRYGIKEGAVVTRLHRLRKKLADYLEQEGVAV